MSVTQQHLSGEQIRLIMHAGSALINEQGNANTDEEVCDSFWSYPVDVRVFLLAHARQAVVMQQARVEANELKQVTRAKAAVDALADLDVEAEPVEASFVATEADESDPDVVGTIPHADGHTAEPGPLVA